MWASSLLQRSNTPRKRRSRLRPSLSFEPEKARHSGCTTGGDAQLARLRPFRLGNAGRPVQRRSARAQLLVATTPGDPPAIAHAELAFASGAGTPVTWLSLRIARGPVALVARYPKTP